MSKQTGEINKTIGSCVASGALVASGAFAGGLIGGDTGMVVGAVGSGLAVAASVKCKFYFPFGWQSIEN